MADPVRYVMNASVAGVGDAGEYVTADPELWGSFVDAGFMSAVDENGERIVVISDSQSDTMFVPLTEDED